MLQRAVHELKCWPNPFAAVRAQIKTFEIRLNDREFQVGDEVVLQEWDPVSRSYTGQVEHRMIRYLLTEEQHGVINGFVAIGFGPLPSQDAPADGPGLTIEDLAAWHSTSSNNAALRAQAARNAAEAYRSPKGGSKALPVAADRHEAVADAAAAEARFHAAAASLVAERA
ncbi:MAG: DUF3850 domain-containing protein [Caulobacter sp.]|nr:DUF3850 domain-containing protein [Caulobacter sp.]